MDSTTWPTQVRAAKSEYLDRGYNLTQAYFLTHKERNDLWLNQCNCKVGDPGRVLS